MGIFIATSVVKGGILLYNNGILMYMPRVGEIFKYLGEDNDSPIQLMILPKEPLKMKARQYINICIPSLGVWSFI